MSDTGDKLNAAYRALPREEPGAALDAAILAHSRRALAKPSAARWAGPVSIAAVLVLAFGVTLHMQEEQPGMESADNYRAPPAAQVAVPAAPPAPEAKNEPFTPAPDALAKKKAMQAAKPDAAPEPQAKLKVAPAEQPRMAEERMAQGRMTQERERGMRDEAAPVQSERKDSKALAKEADSANIAQAPASTSTAVAAAAPAPPPPAARATPAPATAPALSVAPAPAEAPARAQAAPAMRVKREAMAAQAPMGAAADAQAVPDERTRDLEAIAKLRAEGRHEEADKALAEFKRKHPDYRIPDAMWDRVKPR